MFKAIGYLEECISKELRVVRNKKYYLGHIIWDILFVQEGRTEV
jgi:hypothetical protein